MTEYTAHTCISRQVDGAHTAHRAMGKTQTRRCKCLVQLYLYQVNIARGIWCHTSYEPCLGLPRCSELLSAYYLMPSSGYLCGESIAPCLCEGCGLLLQNAFTAFDVRSRVPLSHGPSGGRTSSTSRLSICPPPRNPSLRHALASSAEPV